MSLAYKWNCFLKEKKRVYANILFVCDCITDTATQKYKCVFCWYCQKYTPSWAMGMTHFLKQEHFSQFKDMTDALLCHIHFPVCMWIIDPHSRAAKNASHRNEVLPQDTTHLTHRPCYQRRIPSQDPTGDLTTRRLPDHRKETQTAVVWSCRPFIRSGQNHLARHSKKRKKTRQTEGEVGRQHQGMDRPGVRQIPEGSGEQGKMEETGCEIMSSAPATLVVKG